MKNNDATFCCDLMESGLEDHALQMGYNPIFREYFILYKTKGVIRRIFFCPWCGAKLPERLRLVWIEILETEYGIESPFRSDSAEKIPLEFKSDVWWKKRGL